jgi:hypothetical protein
MTGHSISRRHAMQGAGAATALGFAPAWAQSPVPVPTSELLARASHAELSNGIVTATLYPPGDNAFYHGTRFDRAGVIGSLKLKDQEFYGPWFATRSDARDYVWTDGQVSVGTASSTMGPAEEFDPVGFDGAMPGGTFLLPGVGLLTRPDDKPYDHFRGYAAAHGSDSRSSHAAGNSATMNHAVSGAGFGYDYTKTLTLPPGKPQLVIAHVMRNTGTRPIVTSVYDHNFVILNPGQADMTVTLPFAPPQPPANSRLAVQGSTIHWPQALEERQTGSMTMSTTPQRYDFTVADTRTGASIRAQADVPASQYKLWSIKTVMAVEPYVALDIPPGDEKRWSYTYTYSAP